ncbi:uncharacterized protein V1510DRAFT_408856 [Dipodascopsis tothii]|uniref:uncharacterized protein n=1 Tax=Dipodascopsis tothii TaxID=44089 RepID=UPI0034CFD921
MCSDKTEAEVAALPRDEQRVWYGGTTAKEILDPTNSRIGIHHWAAQGIVGRGVLLDYAAYAERHGIDFSAFSDHQIKLVDLLKCAEEDGVEFRPGDILFMRIGLVPEWNGYSREQRQAYKAQAVPLHAGLEATEDVARWMWDSHFAAVASDAVSWELFPALNPRMQLHQYLLPSWGVPIGELFDLEGLAEICRRLGRTSFFVSSVPFNVVGGVSSAPNAVAIF